MNANAPLTSDVQQQEDKRRKRKALLAGGLVLGLGAAVTLAAWSDDVFANGTFRTGTFEMEGNSSSTMAADAWAQYDTEAQAATLSFRQELSNATTPTELQYNETVWAPLSVRLSEATTADGTYVLTGATWAAGTTSLMATDNVVDYVVYSGVDATTCNATDSTAGTVPTGGTAWYGDTVGTVTAAGPHNLTANASGIAGTPENLCLGVTLTSNDQKYMAQPASTIVWQFTATADS